MIRNCFTKTDRKIDKKKTRNLVQIVRFEYQILCNSKSYKTIDDFSDKKLQIYKRSQ